MQQHPDAELSGRRRQVQSAWIRKTEILVMVLFQRIFFKRRQHVLIVSDSTMTTDMHDGQYHTMKILELWQFAVGCTGRYKMSDL